VDHHDPSRAGLSVTARGVAALRALENRLGDKALVHDSLAEVFAGDLELTCPSSLSNDFRAHMQALLAVRTRFIDDQLLEAVNQRKINQIVILGSGLDARAYRLREISSTVIFEVDFPEVLQVKANLVATTNEKPQCKRVEVAANLGIPSWSDHLQEAGFQPQNATFWLLEGLTGYLTENELRFLLSTIRQLSSTSSRLVATFNGCCAFTLSSWHKFATNTPAELLQELGWNATQYPLHEVAKLFNRDTDLLKGTDSSYWLVVAET